MILTGWRRGSKTTLVPDEYRGKTEIARRSNRNLTFYPKRLKNRMRKSGIHIKNHISSNGKRKSCCKSVCNIRHSDFDI
jgi:hypothetical protein